MQQADDAARQAFWIGRAITAQAFAEIFGFAHVEDAFGGAAKQIDTGTGRNLAEKIAPKPFDQRFGMRKEPKLGL